MKHQFGFHLSTTLLLLTLFKCVNNLKDNTIVSQTFVKKNEFP